MATNEEVFSRGKRAVARFMSMRYSLTSVARAVTDNPDVKVDLADPDGPAPSFTDGKAIYLTPPMALGDDIEHEREHCDERNASGVQTCPACVSREMILAGLYHEIAHIAFGSFRDRSLAARHVMIEAMRLNTHYASEISKRLNGLRRAVLEDFGMAGQYISPYYPILSNAVEDIRVDAMQGKARGGVPAMRRSLMLSTLRDGVEVGDKTAKLSDAPLDAQAITSLIIMANDLMEKGSLDPRVEAEVWTDEQLLQIAREARDAEAFKDTAFLAFRALARLRELGYCLSERDPAEPDDEPEESDDDEGESGDEPDEQGESDDSKSDEQEKSDDESESDDDKSKESDGTGEEESDDGTGEEESESDGSGDDKSDDDGESEGSGGAPSEDGDADADGDESAEDGAGDGDAEGDGGGAEGGDEEGDGEPEQYDAPPTEEERGSADDAAKALQQFSHGNLGGHVDPDKADAEAELMAELANQLKHFDDFSANVTGVRIYKQGERQGAWKTHQYRGYGSKTDPITTHGPIAPTTAELARPLSLMRRVFDENKRAKHETNLKSGRINRRALGTRAWGDDERLFRKKEVPNKRSYFVLIGIDVSGSTSYSGGAILHDIKRAAMAQIELCHRLNVDFAVYAHSGEEGNGEGYLLSIFPIKEPGQLWDNAAKERLASLRPFSANIDGHTMEFYRKVLDRQEQTDRILLYYTDGEMPYANYDEELRVLQREIKTCRQRRYTLLGVGIGTDSPKKHGLDTVRVDDLTDIAAAVRHLESALIRR